MLCVCWVRIRQVKPQRHHSTSQPNTQANPQLQIGWSDPKSQTAKLNDAGSVEICYNFKFRSASTIATVANNCPQTHRQWYRTDMSIAVHPIPSRSSPANFQQRQLLNANSFSKLLDNPTHGRNRETLMQRCGSYMSSCNSLLISSQGCDEIRVTHAWSNEHCSCLV